MSYGIILLRREELISREGLLLTSHSQGLPFSSTKKSSPHTSNPTPLPAPMSLLLVTALQISLLMPFIWGRMSLLKLISVCSWQYLSISWQESLLAGSCYEQCGRRCCTASLVRWMPLLTRFVVNFYEAVRMQPYSYQQKKSLSLIYTPSMKQRMSNLRPSYSMGVMYSWSTQVFWGVRGGLVATNATASLVFLNTLMPLPRLLNSPGFKIHSLSFQTSLLVSSFQLWQVRWQCLGSFSKGSIPAQKQQSSMFLYSIFLFVISWLFNRWLVSISSSDCSLWMEGPTSSSDSHSPSLAGYSSSSVKNNCFILGICCSILSMLRWKVGSSSLMGSIFYFISCWFARAKWLITSLPRLLPVHIMLRVSICKLPFMCHHCLFFRVCFTTSPLFVPSTLARLTPPRSSDSTNPQFRAISLRIWGYISKQSKCTFVSKITLLGLFCCPKDFHCVSLGELYDRFFGSSVSTDSFLGTSQWEGVFQGLTSSLWGYLKVLSFLTLNIFLFWGGQWGSECSLGVALAVTGMEQMFMTSFLGGKLTILKPWVCLTISSLFWVRSISFCRKLLCLALWSWLIYYGQVSFVTAGNLMYIVCIIYLFPYIVILL